MFDSKIGYGSFGKELDKRGALAVRIKVARNSAAVKAQMLYTETQALDARLKNNLCWIAPKADKKACEAEHAEKLRLLAIEDSTVAMLECACDVLEAKEEISALEAKKTAECKKPNHYATTNAVCQFFGGFFNAAKNEADVLVEETFALFGSKEKKVSSAQAKKYVVLNGDDFEAPHRPLLGK